MKIESTTKAATPVLIQARGKGSRFDKRVVKDRQRQKGRVPKLIRRTEKFQGLFECCVVCGLAGLRKAGFEPAFKECGLAQNAGEACQIARITLRVYPPPIESSQSFAKAYAFAFSTACLTQAASNCSWGETDICEEEGKANEYEHGQSYRETYGKV